MIKIEAIVRPEKLEDVKDALSMINVHGITLYQVMGCGAQKGGTKNVRGHAVQVNLIPKIKFEIVVSDEEWARICTIVESLATDGVIVSVDTLHASTAREAARVGAAIINDVSGGRWDPEMNAAVAESGCAYVVQHYRALPGMPGEHFDYGDDLVGTLIERVGSQVQDAIDAGVTPDKIVVDPGLGFSLTGDQCWQILRELPRFAQGGYPVLVGASRKRFVKALEGDVDADSADIAAYCAAAGAWAVRVHDVAATAAAIARKENDVD